MWHKITYESTELPHNLVKKVLPNIHPDDWYWNWGENGDMKVVFRHQKDALEFGKHVNG